MKLGITECCWTLVYLLKERQVGAWWKMGLRLLWDSFPQSHWFCLKENLEFQSDHIKLEQMSSLSNQKNYNGHWQNKQMSDVVKVKLPFVILSVKGFLFHILWSSHLRSPLQTRLKCNLYPRQPSTGRSPDKIMRLKRENIHLKIKFTIHFWPCQQAGPFEIVASSRRI